MVRVEIYKIDKKTQYYTLKAILEFNTFKQRAYRNVINLMRAHGNHNNIMRAFLFSGSDRMPFDKIDLETNVYRSFAQPGGRWFMYSYKHSGSDLPYHCVTKFIA